MMIETEEELLNAIKQWIKKYGKSTLMVILIFLSIGVGWYTANRQNENKISQASILYEELLQSLEKQNTVETQKLAKRLISTYKHTPYAKLSALLLAKQLVENDQLITAKEQLKLVMEKSETPGIRQIARLRLARIQLAENQTDQALTTLKSIEDPAFSPLINQLEGDILAASLNKTAAKTAYQKAIETWPEDLPGKEFIQLKLKHLLPN